jgi:ABC-2 type transport system permease protein
MTKLQRDTGGPKSAYYDSSARRRPEIEELRELWAYRYLVVEMVIRDIKLRYKRSILGVAWTMLTPLLNMVVLTLVFSAILRTAIVNYPVFFMAGSLYWTFFSQGTTYAAGQTHDANELAKRIYIPRSVFVVASVGVALVNLVLSLIPMALICLVTGYRIYATWWFLGVSTLLLIAITAGVGFLIFAMASRFSDIREMYTVLVGTWFFVTPIVYAPSIVPPKYRLLLWLNPHYYLIQVFRDPIYKGTISSPSLLLFSGTMALVALIVGWVYFCRRIDDYAFRT